MPYKEVWIDDNLDEYDDQELIDELENRDWWVSPEKFWEPLELDAEQRQWICDMIVKCDLDATDLVAKEIYNELRKK